MYFVLTRTMETLHKTCSAVFISLLENHSLHRHSTLQLIDK